MTSIIVPAHNEESVIRRCLEAILEDARAGEFQLLVAANGCTDRTEEIVESIEGATLLRVEAKSKVEALNAADRHAGDDFPRLYVDADIQISTSAVRAVAAALLEPGTHAASPELAIDVSRSSRLVKQYYRVWPELPWIRDGVLGSGFYAMSREGRGRFEEFPATFAEDLFVRDLFPPQERQVCRGERFVLSPPRTVKDLLGVRTRIHFANDLYAKQHGRSTAHTPGEEFRRLAAQPWSWIPLGVYLGVNAVAKVRARRQFAAQGEQTEWVRDESART